MPYTEEYKGHKITFWEKSFSVNYGPMLLRSNLREGDVYRMIDAIETETKKRIRAALGVS